MRLLPLLLLLCACVPSKGDLIYSLDGKETTPVVIESVSLAELQSEILVKCTSCHRWARSEAGILSRVVRGDPDSSVLYLRTQDGSMPEDGAPLSTRELEMIRVFITNLAPSN